MQIETRYALKLFFSSPTFEQVYFEAVANAIDAGANTIRVEIKTNGQAHEPEIEISVRDNGVGFTDERYDRFCKLKEPSDKFHKGLGRLVYLQYFSEVEVTSCYASSVRTFRFVHDFNGKSKVATATPEIPRGTTLTFRRFSGERIKSYDDLKAGSVRDALLRQFLPILYQRKLEGQPIRIDVSLETTNENRQRDFFSETHVLDESTLPELKVSQVKDPTVDLFSEVQVAYAISRDQPRPLLITAANVDGRTIPLNLVPQSSVPAGTSVVFLFTSELFSGRSDSARQRLVLADGVNERALYRALRSEIGRLLCDELPEIRTRNQEVTESFEERFPHLIGLFEAETVGLINRDEIVEAAQQRFFHAQKQVLESDPSDENAFQKSLELSARSLMEYVLYRDWVIKRLLGTSYDTREETIHNLLVPRFERFEQSSLVEDVYRNNAWILDDKFMTFRTILSEATMNDVINEITLEEDSVEDKGRPDISMIFSADPNSQAAVDVVVIELKRKTDDDKENGYASRQLVKRARKLVDHCPSIQRAWYYGIVEIDEQADQLLRDEGWTPLHSKGRVFYKEHSLVRKTDGVHVPTPIFLLSFDAVTEDAAARNHAFLELLKSKFKRAEGISAVQEASAG